MNYNKNMEQVPSENVELTLEQKAALDVVKKRLDFNRIIQLGNTYETIHLTNLDEDSYNELYQAFELFGVFPWIEETGEGYEIVIERQKDLAILSDLLKEKKSETTEEKEALPLMMTESADKFAFGGTRPLTAAPQKKGKPAYQQEELSHPEDPPDVDQFFESNTDYFESGRSSDPTQTVSKPEWNKHPNLKAFQREFFREEGGFKNLEGEIVTDDEFKYLLADAKNNPETLAKAAKMNVGLVNVITQRMSELYPPAGVSSIDDYFQAGMEGLVRGIRNYEVSEEYKPSSFIVPYVEGYIRRYIGENKPVYRRPAHVTSELAKFYRARRELEKKGGFEDVPYFEQLTQIAEESGMSLGTVRRVAKTSKHRKVSLSATELDSSQLESTNESTFELDTVDQQKLEGVISETLDELSPREELMTRLSFGLLGESRWRNVDKMLSEVVGDGFENIYNGSIHRLAATKLEDLDTETLSNGEKAFLVLIGKMPPEAFAEIEDGINSPNGAVSLEDIAQLTGVTRERVRQVINKVLRKFKHPRNSRHFRGFLP